MNAGGLSLLSVTVMITVAFTVNPFPSMSAASITRVCFGYFCWGDKQLM